MSDTPFICILTESAGGECWLCGGSALARYGHAELRPDSGGLFCSDDCFEESVESFPRRTG
jgi:hypothetical protein